MRNDLGMKFCKIVQGAVHTNSERNLILRQQCALVLIGMLHNKKILLNIDETWLGMSDFRRRKWKAEGTTNSVSIMQIIPRISMIVGLDTLGNVFCSLTQSNSNATVMRVFFVNLVRRLDRERPTWRNDTVIVLDNAPYHVAQSTLKLFEQLRVPVLFLGAHSYSAAPCELFFAWFKDEDINPRHLPVGKK